LTARRKETASNHVDHTDAGPVPDRELSRRKKVPTQPAPPIPKSKSSIPKNKSSRKKKVVSWFGQHKNTAAATAGPSSPPVNEYDHEYSKVLN
jgi:hypothetical protein